MMNPKVSIVIPVYNVENVVRRTVESLIYGEEKNIEIILVEDCSKDKSWEVCKELHEEFENVRCVRNEKNSGVSYTRNHGIEEAVAPYIMFVDSDDWVSAKYVSKMLIAATSFEDCIPVCGFHFWDQVNYSKIDYLWNKENRKDFILISGTELFGAVDKIMLQFCWNKIFKSEVIEKNKIRFDESQSMGEDFEFVLDYMMAAHIKKCVMVNEPLYYYIRANQNSLMSDFGWTSNKAAYQRMVMLAEICGLDNIDIQKCLDEQKLKLEENSIYHVIRSPGRKRKEKIARIEEIVENGTGIKIYKKHMCVYRREKVRQALSGLKKIAKRVRGRLQRKKTVSIIEAERMKLNRKDISIISQNCIGGVFYHDMDMPFLSPTINLFIKEPDFIKFVLDLKNYLKLEMQVEWKEEYPVGKLGDIEIYFMHYNSCKEAKLAWNRRKARINFDKILVVSTDRNGFTDEVYEQWKKIPYKKVLFSVNENWGGENTVLYPEYAKQGFVPDLIPSREFYKSSKLIDVINSMN